MGCVQAKSGSNSPPQGLDRLKMENGYVGKGGYVCHRRSTGQRYSEKELTQPNIPEPPRKWSENMIENVEKVEFGIDRDEMVDGWPKWLVDNVPSEFLAGMVPRSAESYDKIDKVGQGTYSNVYKARDRETGMIVALKKVRFDTLEPESVRFMAREVMILQKLNHPNIVKLEGLATSRMQYSIYLVFDFMVTDLSTVISRPEERLTEPQIKCYMHQLLSGLQHCHERGILHRDIKGSNLLIDKNGVLKIADFGLANLYSPNHKHPLTSRVVTLWYRAPELLLGATNYGIGIDLWSAGCLLAEMFTGWPIMPGRNEIEQLHKTFKLCGTPSEEYWKKLGLLSTTFRPPRSYKPSFVESFREFPESALGLLSTLLALDPEFRGSASLALNHDFFYTSPQACDLSGLPAISYVDDVATPAIVSGKKRSSKSRRTVLGNKLGSSSTSTTSSGSKATTKTENRDAPNAASRNSRNRPPLPASQIRAVNDKGNGNEFSRSASTREFRKMNQRKYLEGFAADD